MNPPEGPCESLVLTLVAQREGEEQDCAPQRGECLFMGWGGFPMREYIGESASDMSSGSGELIYWCFPFSASVVAMALDKLPAD